MSDDELRELLTKSYEKKSFRDVYRTYRDSDGTVKVILGDLVAQRLNDDDAFIFDDDIKGILDCARPDTLWMLSTESKNDCIREDCSKRLEGYIINDKNVDLLKAKMRKKKLKKLYGGEK